MHTGSYEDGLIESDRTPPGPVPFSLEFEKIMIITQPGNTKDFTPDKLLGVGLVAMTVYVYGLASHLGPPVAVVVQCCKYSMVLMLQGTGVARVVHMLDGDRFFRAVDRRRVDEGLSWRELARRMELSASTLSRLARGRTPDLDTFLRLIAWLGEPAEAFITVLDPSVRRDTLSEIARALEDDPALGAEDVNAINQIVKVAYRRLKRGAT